MRSARALLWEAITKVPDLCRRGCLAGGPILVLTEPLPTKRALFGWKGSLSFRQQGLLMTSNKNHHGNGGSEGQDEQPDANRSGNSMYRGAEHISADPENR